MKPFVLSRDTGKSILKTIAFKNIVVPAILFWTFTYIMLSIRAALLTHGGPLVSERRAFLTLIGAIIYGTALRLLPASLVSRPNSIRLIILPVVAAALFLFAVRVAYVWGIRGDPGIPESSRWALIWTGYFAAWLFGSLILSTKAPESSLPSSRRADGLQAASAPTLWVDRGRERIQVSIQNVRHLRSEGNYVRVYYPEGSGLVRGSLAEFESKLGRYGFIRIHRSSICSRAHIKALSRNSSGTRIAVIEDGTELPVGRRYAAAVTQLINL